MHRAPGPSASCENFSASFSKCLRRQGQVHFKAYSSPKDCAACALKDLPDAFENDSEPYIESLEVAELFDSPIDWMENDARPPYHRSGSCWGEGWGGGGVVSGCEAF